MAELQELQQAAADVIGYMKTISDYSNARVSVIGGLALWMYLADGRSTQVHTLIQWAPLVASVNDI